MKKLLKLINLSSIVGATVRTNQVPKNLLPTAQTNTAIDYDSYYDSIRANALDKDANYNQNIEKNIEKFQSDPYLLNLLERLNTHTSFSEVNSENQTPIPNLIGESSIISTDSGGSSDGESSSGGSSSGGSSSGGSNSNSESSNGFTANPEPIPEADPTTLELLDQIWNNEDYLEAYENWRLTDGGFEQLSPQYIGTESPVGGYQAELSKWKSQPENWKTYTEYINSNDSNPYYLSWLESQAARNTLEPLFVNQENTVYQNYLQNYLNNNIRSERSFAEDDFSNSIYQDWVNSFDGYNALRSIYINQSNNIEDDQYNLQNSYLTWINNMVEDAYFFYSKTNNIYENWIRTSPAKALLAPLYQDSTTINVHYRNWRNHPENYTTPENWLLEDDQSDFYTQGSYPTYLEWIKHPERIRSLRDFYKASDAYVDDVNEYKSHKLIWSLFLSSDDVEDRFRPVFDTWIDERGMDDIIALYENMTSEEFKKQNFNSWIDGEYTDDYDFHLDWVDYTKSYANDEPLYSVNQNPLPSSTTFRNFLKSGDEGWFNYKMDRITNWLDEVAPPGGSFVDDLFSVRPTRLTNNVWIQDNEPRSISGILQNALSKESQEEAIDAFLTKIFKVDNGETNDDTIPNSTFQDLVNWVMNDLLPKININIYDDDIERELYIDEIEPAPWSITRIRLAKIITKGTSQLPWNQDNHWDALQLVYLNNKTLQWNNKSQHRFIWLKDLEKTYKESNAYVDDVKDWLWSKQKFWEKDSSNNYEFLNWIINKYETEKNSPNSELVNSFNQWWNTSKLGENYYNTISEYNRFKENQIEFLSAENGILRKYDNEVRTRFLHSISSSYCGGGISDNVETGSDVWVRCQFESLSKPSINHFIETGLNGAFGNGITTWAKDKLLGNPFISKDENIIQIFKNVAQGNEDYTEVEAHRVVNRDYIEFKKQQHPISSFIDTGYEGDFQDGLYNWAKLHKNLSTIEAFTEGIKSDSQNGNDIARESYEANWKFPTEQNYLYSNQYKTDFKEWAKDKKNTNPINTLIENILNNANEENEDNIQFKNHFEFWRKETEDQYLLSQDFKDDVNAWSEKRQNDKNIENIIANLMQNEEEANKNNGNRTFTSIIKNLINNL